jgi:hypothetical protein
VRRRPLSVKFHDGVVVSLALQARTERLRFSARESFSEARGSHTSLGFNVNLRPFTRVSDAGVPWFSQETHVISQIVVDQTRGSRNSGGVCQYTLSTGYR